MTDQNYMRIVMPPKPAKWRAKLTPGGHATYRPSEGNVPCWFHRQMHRIFFGIVWEEIK